MREQIIYLQRAVHLLYVYVQVSRAVTDTVSPHPLPVFVAGKVVGNLSATL